ncbi:MAG: hypothetical protein HGA76_10345 [Candidatus Firestonebacteria bacterium]|nr:hypothetical protein [Candidatus Firestonebacteria bacterium]
MSAHPELLLGTVLAIAVYTDLAQRKVYNVLTYPALLAAVVWHTAAHGWLGLGFSLLGLTAGGLIFFPAFWAGGMGAGDIKLMAVVGAFLGWRFALNAALDAAVIGGVFAVVFLLVKRELWSTLHRTLRLLFPGKTSGVARSASYALPYAVFISLGAVAAFFLPSLIALP